MRSTQAIGQAVRGDASGAVAATRMGREPRRDYPNRIEPGEIARPGHLTSFGEIERPGHLAYAHDSDKHDDPDQFHVSVADRNQPPALHFLAPRLTSLSSS